ncbi:hypothetical protein AAFC00_000878 [Neodothiora populina]|uniref:CENP-V/GFA domain-containing protein n=1 Tax=Neodothiora populina TaxID=2781224 RepID=A0ABR3PN44_9PEZI
MPKGSCLCGKVTISYDADPAMKALCHCVDCRKMTGSAYSTNVVVPSETFKVTGSPKVFTKVADSGNKAHSYFCGDCGCPLYRDSESFKGLLIVKAGCLDGEGALDAASPGAEMYAPERVSWQPEISGVQQLKAME